MHRFLPYVQCECEHECHRVNQELWQSFTNLEQERHLHSHCLKLRFDIHDMQMQLVFFHQICEGKTKFVLLCSHSHQSVHGSIHLPYSHSHLCLDMWKPYCAFTCFLHYFCRIHICKEHIWNFSLYAPVIKRCDHDMHLNNNIFVTCNV